MTEISRFHLPACAWVLPVLTATIIQCKPVGRESSQVQEFEKVSVEGAKGRPIPDFLLTRAPKVRVKAVEYTVPGFEGLPQEASKHIEVTFPGLTKNEFDILNSAYGKHGHWLKGRKATYDITDFLPPIVQATVKHRFHPHYIQYVPGGFEELQQDGTYKSSLTANCWGTVYEYLRGDPQSLKIFYASNRQIGEILLDATYSSHVKVLNQSQVFGDVSKTRNTGLVPGDILVVLKNDAMPMESERHNYYPGTSAYPTEIVHAAIYIDNDLYFEKTGFSGRALYRIVSFQNILIDNREDHSFIYRRSTGASQMPDPKVAFGLDNTPLNDMKIPGRTIERVATIPYNYNKETGRAELPDTAYVREAFDKFLLDDEVGGSKFSNSPARER